VRGLQGCPEIASAVVGLVLVIVNESSDSLQLSNSWQPWIPAPYLDIEGWYVSSQRGALTYSCYRPDLGR
jgi:hypothetical protein